MMHKTRTKAWSWLLSLALVLGLFPAFGMTALAADTTSYTLTIPSTLSVANSGWNATSGISATGTLESGKKLTVTASSGDEFALVNQSDNTQKVGYKLATASTDTEATTSWTFDSLSDTAATKPMGIIVEDYSNKPAGNYTDTVTFTASVESAQRTITWVCVDEEVAYVNKGSGNYENQKISATGIGDVEFMGLGGEFAISLFDQNSSLTFSSTDGGKISKIVIKATNVKNALGGPYAGKLSSGWDLDGATLTWNGTPSESVTLSLTENTIGVERISTIEFTVE